MRRFIFLFALLTTIIGLTASAPASAQTDARPHSLALPAGWTVVVPGDVSTASTDALRFTANDKYVSAELGGTGDQYARLRARAISIGPWEQFTFYASGSVWALRSNEVISAR